MSIEKARRHRKKWWKGLPENEQKDRVQKAGKARWESMNPGKRREMIRRMVDARRAKAGKK